MYIMKGETMSSNAHTIQKADKNPVQKERHRQSKELPFKNFVLNTQKEGEGVKAQID